MNELQRINSLLSDYRLGFIYNKEGLLKMSARIRMGKVLTSFQKKLLCEMETRIHNLNPLGKKMIVNDEEAFVITTTLPREDGDIPAYPKSNDTPTPELA